MLFNNNIIASFFDKKYSSYYGGGKKYSFYINNGLTSEFKNLLLTLINGNVYNLSFNLVRFVIEDNNNEFIMCECGKCYDSDGERECECGNKNCIDIYLSQSEEYFLTRTIYRLYDRNKTCLVFNSFIKYNLGVIEIEVLSPMHIDISNESISVSESYIDAYNNYGKILLKKYSIDEAYMSLYASIDTSFLCDIDVSSGIKFIYDRFSEYADIYFGEDFLYETLGYNLMLLDRCLKHNDLFIKGCDNPIVCTINKAIAKHINEYYNDLSWDYKNNDYKYDGNMDTEDIDKIMDCINRKDIDTIMSIINSLLGDIDLNNARLYNISSILKLISILDEDSLNYLSLYLHKTSSYMSLRTVFNLLSLYDKAIYDGKIISVLDYLKYIIRYCESECVSIEKAIYNMLESYVVIERFKGSFTSALYRRSLVKKSLSEDNFTLFEKLKSADTFNEIYSIIGENKNLHL